MLRNKRTVKVFRAILALFLDPQRTTLLQNVRGMSASTASRFFSGEHTTDEALWERLNRWQTEQLYAKLPRRGRRGDMVLKLDLTCIEKTGRRIPFAWPYNRSYGIQLVVLHACWGGLRFPLGYRIYAQNSPKSATDLATDLLKHYRHLLDPSRVVVMADAGFGHDAFIRDGLAMGYRRLLVGVRCDRRLSGGRKLNTLTKRGEQVSLETLPKIV
ncbi:MAG: transposase [Trueperaceae bacterium]|nr:transposase [Trueperaceae bacterium]